MNPITLTIEGMSCAHCVTAATEALTAVPGVTAVRVSLTPGMAIIDGTAAPEALIAALAEEGYSAVVQPAP